MIEQLCNAVLSHNVIVPYIYSSHCNVLVGTVANASQFNYF